MNRKQMDSDPINTPKPDTLGNVSIDDYIFRIEDYVGGNIEGVETIDRMGFTVFLRRILEEVLDQTEAIFNEAILEARIDELQEIADTHGEMGVTKKFLYDRLAELRAKLEEAK